jgi:hypothetical protein
MLLDDVELVQDRHVRVADLGHREVGVGRQERVRRPSCFRFRILPAARFVLSLQIRQYPHEKLDSAAVCEGNAVRSDRDQCPATERMLRARSDAIPQGGFPRNHGSDYAMASRRTCLLADVGSGNARRPSPLERADVGRLAHVPQGHALASGEGQRLVECEGLGRVVDADDAGGDRLAF